MNKGILPKHLLANILHHLTTGELDVMSKLSGYILETILQYNLYQRLYAQGQIYELADTCTNRIVSRNMKKIFIDNTAYVDDNGFLYNCGKRIFIPDDKKVIQVSWGCESTGVITEDGLLYMFGDGHGGKLGDGRFEPHYVSTPTLVQFDKKVIQVSCGDMYTIIITENGQLYILGSDFDMWYTEDISAQFARVIFDKKVIQVSCGQFYTVAITENGQLYMFPGEDIPDLISMDEMQNWVERPISVVVEEPILIPLGAKVIQVSCVEFHTYMVTEDGEVYIFDRNRIPILIPFDKKVIQVSCGKNYTLLVTEDGLLYMLKRDGIYPSLIPLYGKVIQVSSSNVYMYALVREPDDLKWLKI